MTAVDRRCYPPKTFLFDRAKKIARIFAPTQSGFRYRRCVETALESESRFNRGVVNSAHHEVFAAVSLRPPRQLLIFVRQPLHNFRPRNVRAKFRASHCQNTKTCDLRG
jgi:hypothetical protein